ncbi:MAG: tRNA epoxyqueuosine(34) reductase QueG [Elusimicrobia bacterium]|nr:tRNA epoxyqueuosine(34) reductase QueG [Elusimicrobiota bacterium]
MTLAAELKERARQAGASLAGIASARPAAQAALAEGLLPGPESESLAYLRRDADVRQDIRRWYPEAKSVLVCGFSYGGQGPTVPEGAGPSPLAGRDAGMGRIARYALHEDYHRSLKLRMQEVLAWLRDRQPGADGRIFVDSSPVRERLYGAAAGLGWIGRNRLLISETAGSFFLIAGLALNLELEPDRPVPGRCGSCRRCLDACPTGALGPEGGFRAGRCIAYLTIEHRGPVPPGLRRGVGCWVAGCDLCQEACPWNEGRTAAGVLEPLLPGDLPLAELAGLGEPSFRERFGRTPLTRLKRRGLARNALLAMGNSGDARLRPVLERFRADPDPVLQEQALWSLSRLPD